MTYRHTEEQINQYKASTAINQSALKSLLEDGVQAFIRNFQSLVGQEEKLYYEEKDWQIIGSAVDDYITMGVRYFNAKYYISKLVKKPAPAVMSIIKMVFDSLVLVIDKVTIGKDLSIYKEQLWEACNSNNFYMNNAKSFEDDTRVDNRILKDARSQAYWEDLIPSVGKQILSDTEKSLIYTITNSFLNHPHTSHLFEHRKEIDIIYQMPLYFIIDGIECKVLPDMIRIEHETKRIKGLDIKTMIEDVLKFNKVIRKRRYDIQGSIYLTGIKENLENISKVIGKDITKYDVSGFAFIVESKTTPGIPIIFPMTKELIRHGEWGSTIPQQNKGRNYKGWQQMLQLYKKWGEAEWKIENRLDSKGIAFINDDFEYLIDM